MATMTKADITNARNGVYECREALKEIAEMEECGLECQERRQRAEHIMGFLEKRLEQAARQQSLPGS